MVHIETSPGIPGVVQHLHLGSNDTDVLAQKIVSKLSSFMFKGFTEKSYQILSQKKCFSI